MSSHNIKIQIENLYIKVTEGTFDETDKDYYENFDNSTKEDKSDKDNVDLGNNAKIFIQICLIGNREKFKKKLNI